MGLPFFIVVTVVTSYSRTKTVEGFEAQIPQENDDARSTSFPDEHASAIDIRNAMKEKPIADARSKAALADDKPIGEDRSKAARAKDLVAEDRRKNPEGLLASRSNTSSGSNPVDVCRAAVNELALPLGLGLGCGVRYSHNCIQDIAMQYDNFTRCAQCVLDDSVPANCVEEECLCRTVSPTVSPTPSPTEAVTAKPAPVPRRRRWLDRV